MTEISTAPPRVRSAEPFPPVIAVPPTRTAAITSRVSVPPRLVVALVLNDARKTPVIARHRPKNAQARTMTRPTGNPAARAAARFSPTRYICRPAAVRRRIHWASAASTSRT